MLSVQQEKAVKSMDKVVLVAAAAGSGKTRVIVEHIKFLIEQGTDPSKIYAITYTNSAAQEMLERLNDAPVFIGTIHSLANKILRNNGINTSDWIEEQAFDKLLERINEDYYNEIELPEIEHLLVDEFQDVCDDEANFILYSLKANHIFVVGDSCQCQPAGTMVRLRNNVFKPIEEIEIGDSVVWYNNEKSYLCGPTTKAWNTKELKVVDKAVRPFIDDNLITITTEKGESSTYTPNHRTFIRLKRTEYEHVVYLMCDSNYRFRIGKIPMYSGKGATLPWRTKMLNEGCSKIWLLKAFKTDKEARLLENKLSYQYGIPQTCWQTDKVQWTAADIDFIYSELDTFTSAKLCLESFNRNIDFPLLDKDSENTYAMHFATNAVSEIYACNIMPDLMECIVYNPELPKNKDYQTITSVDYKYIDTPTNVYSLKIEEYGTYIADNIVTHNSIYGFKGANYHRFMDLAKNKNTTLFKLETNYRNPSYILNYANQFLKGMDDVYRINSIPNNQNYGIVEEEEYNIKNIGYYITKNGKYGEWFVLARTNAQVDDILTYLRNKDIPCTTFKKSEKTYDELKDEFKNNTVKVLTIHSAKGLEANNVVVVGMKQFNAEEKRICYVACTRARERLIVMTAPARGKRRQMNMYDDAVGPTITW
jgi:DNA helicase-2/ATP-dependent DNA helicase PcrA